MAEFPTREREILDLARRIRRGVTDHPADFPHVFTGFLILKLLRTERRIRQANQAGAALKLARADARRKLQTLRTEMKRCLKLAESDSTDCPARLSLIGWAPPTPRAARTRRTAPNPPTDLRIVARHHHRPPRSDGHDRVELDLVWQASRTTTNNRADLYRIEMRTPEGCTAVVPADTWQLLTVADATAATLTNLSLDAPAELRIVATNKAGASGPSNTVAI